MLEQAKVIVESKKKEVLKQVEDRLCTKELDNMERRNLQVLRKGLVSYFHAVDKLSIGHVRNGKLKIRNALDSMVRIGMEPTFLTRKQFADLDTLVRVLRVGMFDKGTVGYEKVERIIRETEVVGLAGKD
ncbi:hypothetical protein CN495_08025 [Bacillus thuringiensis]|uniref:Uncharacterized protein n=1 Tax=Bacillus thuringiensis TaxID=1428 RepID=A0ABD6SCP4_BACTU|nr:hypothetical protein [Bacillus thuringiensis]PER55692.1 hypothetical protein CN495_08025 [Bacillus thuringiensis]